MIDVVLGTNIQEDSDVIFGTNIPDDEAVEFLFEPLVPKNALTLLTGYAGVGKSFISIDFMAAVTRGIHFRVANRSNSQTIGSRCLYVRNEDALNVIGARMKSAGAAKDKWLVFGENVNLRSYRIDNYIRKLQDTITEYGIKLVVIDPLFSNIPSVVSPTGAHATDFLMKLSEMAEKLECTIILVNHLKKSSRIKDISDINMDDSLGCRAFTGAVRSVLLAWKEDDDSNSGVLVHLKSNLGKIGKPINYSIVDNAISWGMYSNILSNSKRSNRFDVRDYIIQELTLRPLTGANFEAKRKEHKISEKTWDRAKKEAGADYDPKTKIWSIK